MKTITRFTSGILLLLLPFIVGAQFDSLYSVRPASTLFSSQKAESQLIIKDNKTGYHTAVNSGKPVNAGVNFKTACSNNSYTITASTADTNVTIKPAGVTSVDAGDSQQYTITPKTGYDIADVEVDSVSIGAAISYTFTNVQANHTISASSAIQTFAITASSKGEGNISPAGTTIVNYNGNVTYTITPNDEWHTESILVDGVEQDVSLTEYTFTKVKEDHTISVKFAIDTFTIISSSSDTNVTIKPAGVTSVDAGGSQQYTITPNKGYDIADVEVDSVSIGAATSYTFTNVQANHTITASSAIQAFAITASSKGEGNISPAGTTIVNYNGKVTYTITPNDGWHTESILVDGVAQDVSLTKYTFTKVKEDHKISVTFATNIFTIVSSSSGGGKVIPEGETIVNAGDQQSYIMKGNEGFEVSDVIIDGTSIGVVQEYTFYNVMEGHTIHVDFKQASPPNLPPESVPAFRTIMSSKGIVTTLTGELSSDPDGNIVSYNWLQTAGTTVNIEQQSDKNTIVTGLIPGTYKFQLTVTDNSGDASVATIKVRVLDESAPWGKKYAIEITPSVKK